MTELQVDDALVEEVADDLDDLQSLFEQYLTIDAHFVQQFGETIARFSGTLQRSVEFRALGDALQQLVTVMDRLSGQLDDTQRMMAYMLLEQFVADLRGWFAQVFVERTAVDIHYLDAALLAAIAQLEMIFGQPQPQAS